MTEYQKIREECCQGNIALGQSGLVDLTFGNLSVFDPGTQCFAIKPSGMNYAELTPELMVVLNLDSKVVWGDHRPSSDSPTHSWLFKEWGHLGVCSVVHTHSRNAVAFAQAGIPLPALGTTHADYFNGSVPLTEILNPSEIEKDYERATGQAIVRAFAETSPLEIPAVLVQSHGPFAWGGSASKALENALALEIIADMAVKTLGLNPQKTAMPDYLRLKHFRRKHGPDAYYGQPNNVQK
ncbi:MAG: L-ribulose-5-phosphate 4-epimerase AraD [Verrucomicrobiales bacterium]